MGKGGDAPTGTPAAQVIADQTAANSAAAKESAAMSAVDIYSPFGSTTYSRRADGTPKAQRTRLTPEAQRALDAQLGVSSGLAQNAEQRVAGLPTDTFAFNAPYDPRGYDTSAMPTTQSGVADPTMLGETPEWSGQILSVDGLPYDPRGYGDVQAYSNNAGDAVYAQHTRQLDPQFEASDRAFEQQMSDRGIPSTSEAYRIAKADYERTKTDAYQSARNASIAAAAGEADRLMSMEQGLRSTAFGEDQAVHQQGVGDWLTQLNAQLQTHGVRNSDQAMAWQQDMAEQQQEQADWLTGINLEQTLRGTANQEDITQRNQQINEIAALIQGSPAIQMPAIPQVPTYNIAPADVGGAYANEYNAQMNAYNQQQQQNAAIWQGALGAASAAIPFMF